MGMCVSPLPRTHERAPGSHTLTNQIQPTQQQQQAELASWLSLEDSVSQPERPSQLSIN